ncbi:MAG: glycosyltransferase family 2 protein [Bacteroidetes bacterium]|nr:glycosyltransferase family 2 protein [Bacteroidota bacterium]
MYNNKKVVVVLPAYNAEKTLEQTLREVPMNVVDELILVDDASKDGTFGKAKQLGVHHVIKHEKNKGYGGNQKTCYTKALEIGADIVVMLHPDYQYTPKLLTAMISIIGNEVYPVVFGSRILGGGALKGGMPMYKYVFNRFLTLTQNILLGEKLSEYHTGYRAFNREVLTSIKFMSNSDDFVFDNQMVSQIFYKNFEIGEVTCPTKYFEGASSINFSRSVTYGLGCLQVSLLHRLCKLGILKSDLY